MKIGILGTGMVGNTLGTALVSKGYEVKMGSRSANNEKAMQWAAQNGGKASVGTFSEASKFGEVVFNCTKGENSLEALKMAGADNLKSKILIDVSNPLDFSKGMPPTLTLCNDTSLGETIQAQLPDSKVVKALNTVNCVLMVDPKRVNNGDHNIFVCGNDVDAKERVKQLLHDAFGWSKNSIIDLGDITNSRATEQILPIWVRLYGYYKSPDFNFKIVR